MGCNNQYVSIRPSNSETSTRIWLGGDPDLDLAKLGPGH